MKRFITLVALVLGLATATYAVASAPIDKAENPVSYIHSTVLLMAHPDMSPTMEVIPEWVAVLTMGKASEGYEKSVFHPPTVNSKYLR